MILIDTTILVYATGTEHALRAPSRALIDRVADGRVSATTTVEVIHEFAHVRARRLGRSDAARQARRFAIGLAPLMRPDAQDLSDALDLLEASSSLGSFDSVLAARARRRGWELASADRGFAEVATLEVLDPASPNFLERLG
ncbi:MAG: type II toxin-antitoxin system VapC family toxin [Actinobacteria bacterium]|nr:type II toxin-antitoxin system VapC family toxin [Actinomycetota bacterium]